MIGIRVKLIIIYTIIIVVIVSTYMITQQNNECCLKSIINIIFKNAELVEFKDIQQQQNKWTISNVKP